MISCVLKSALEQSPHRRHSRDVVASVPAYLVSEETCWCLGNCDEWLGWLLRSVCRSSKPDFLNPRWRGRVTHKFGQVVVGIEDKTVNRPRGRETRSATNPERHVPPASKANPCAVCSWIVRCRTPLSNIGVLLGSLCGFCIKIRVRQSNVSHT